MVAPLEAYNICIGITLDPTIGIRKNKNMLRMVYLGIR